KTLIEKWEKRQVKIEEFHVEDCKKLLQFMGVPFITAISEAEAYCAYLCKTERVKGVATEDMDALCFGASLLLRNLNASQVKRIEIDEYRLSMILKELDLSMDGFIDMCILLGCDFCDTIKGVGPKRAFEYIKKHGSIESILENEKLEIPENFDFKAARLIFKELSEVGDENQNLNLEREKIDREGLIGFMCGEKGFDKTRIENGIERMVKMQKRSCQLRLDSFFKSK
ncbi:flap endonuclease-1, partial [Pancytospora epiphaga]